MAGAFLFLLIGLYSIPRAVIFALCIFFVVVSLLALLKNRWAIAISVLVAIILMLRWLPMVIINTWMFISGHELYQDSPATILVVLSYAIVFAIPSTILNILYFVNRKPIWQFVRHGKDWST